MTGNNRNMAGEENTRGYREQYTKFIRLKLEWQLDQSDKDKLHQAKTLAFEEICKGNCDKDYFIFLNDNTDNEEKSAENQREQVRLELPASHKEPDNYYLHGIGYVFGIPPYEKDTAEAEQCFQNISQDTLLGPAATTMLAHMRDKGNQTGTEAYNPYHIAHKLNHPSATSCLATKLSLGKTHPNYTEDEKLDIYKKAADLGNPDAMLQLAQNSGTSAKDMEFYKQAAVLGNITAIDKLMEHAIQMALEHNNANQRSRAKVTYLFWANYRSLMDRNRRNDNDFYFRMIITENTEQEVVLLAGMLIYKKGPVNLRLCPEIQEYLHTQTQQKIIFNWLKELFQEQGPYHPDEFKLLCATVSPTHPLGRLFIESTKKEIKEQLLKGADNTGIEEDDESFLPPLNGEQIPSGFDYDFTSPPQTPDNLSESPNCLAACCCLLVCGSAIAALAIFLSLPLPVLILSFFIPIPPVIVKCAAVMVGLEVLGGICKGACGFFGRRNQSDNENSYGYSPTTPHR